MGATSFLRSVGVSTCHCVALGLLHLASTVRRSTTRLYERQRIPRACIKAALSVPGVLERVEWKQVMFTVSVFQYLRQMGALVLFRLSNRVIRIGISLHRMQIIPRFSVRLALSASSIFEKMAALLLFGRRHGPPDNRFDREFEK
jgi:hypothetical protein